MCIIKVLCPGISGNYLKLLITIGGPLKQVSSLFIKRYVIIIIILFMSARCVPSAIQWLYKHKQVHTGSQSNLFLAR